MTDTDEERKARIQNVWEQVWVPILYPQGKFDVEQLKLELYDYTLMMSEVGKAYSHLTGGVVSNPTTFAFDVVRIHNELWEPKHVTGDLPTDSEILQQNGEHDTTVEADPRLSDEQAT